MDTPMTWTVAMTREQVAAWERDPSAFEAYVRARLKERFAERLATEKERLQHELLYGTGNEQPIGILQASLDSE